MLLGDGNAIGLAMLADQHLDEIGDGAMVPLRRDARGFLQARVDAQVERGGLGEGHGGGSTVAMWRHCNADVLCGKRAYAVGG